MRHDRQPPSLGGERDVREIGEIESELAKIDFPASKRTLVDALGDRLVHYGDVVLQLDRVIGELDAEEFNSPDDFLRHLGGEIARRIVD